MKLGVFSPVLASMSLEDALRYLSGLGVEMLELGCGGCPGKAHADVMELDKSEKKRKELKDLFDKYHMEISALSVHGNGVHPVKEVAKVATDEFAAACRVAEKLGVAIEFVEIDWDRKVDELDGKGIDVVWNGMTLTDGVKAAMECTNAYCENAQVVVTK